MLSSTAAGPYHQPHRARPAELVAKSAGGSAGRLSPASAATAFGDRSKTPFMTILQEDADHVGTHPPQADHSELHEWLLNSVAVQRSRRRGDHGPGDRSMVTL